jgi:hypothetical protein
LPWGKSFDAVGILSQDVGLIREVFEILCDRREAEVNIKRVVISDEVNQLASHRAAQVVRKFAQEFANANNFTLEKAELSDVINNQTRDLFSRIARAGKLASTW